MVAKSVEPKVLTKAVLIVVLSAVIFLLICILITFYVLYNYVFPKQIYFVQEKGEWRGC